MLKLTPSNILYVSKNRDWAEILAITRQNACEAINALRSRVNDVRAFAAARSAHYSEVATLNSVAQVTSVSAATRNIQGKAAVPARKPQVRCHDFQREFCILYHRCWVARDRADVMVSTDDHPHRRQKPLLRR